jgi:signal transduction histidine kinase/CheY-like chemotaxis protein
VPQEPPTPTRVSSRTEDPPSDSAQVQREELELLTEEFQAANEELQASNDELHLVNQELRVSQQELRQLRDESETVRRIGATLAGELDLQRLVQTVTDAATELTGAEFGAFFYNVIDAQGEAYLLYTLSGVPREAFESFPMPRNTKVFEPTFSGRGVVRLDDVTQDPRYGKNPPYHGMPEGHLPVRSYLAVPVISRTGEVHGGLFFGHSAAGQFRPAHERMVAGIAAQAAIAIDNARLYGQVQQVLAEREEALRMHRSIQERLLLLAEASRLLLPRAGGGDVVPAILDLARKLLAADAYAIWRLDPETGFWSALAQANLSPEYPSIIPQSGSFEVTQPFHIQDVEAASVPAERRAAYRREGVRSLLCAPMEVLGQVAGTLVFYYREPHECDPADLEVASALANLAAGALATTELYQEQTRMRTEAERAHQRLRFLAEATRLLSSSLDYTATLEHVAELLVPCLADWCTVHLLEDGQIVPVAVAHVDPEKVKWAREYGRRYPPDPDAAHGIARVLRCGEPVLYPEITDEMLGRLTQDSERLAIIRQIGFTSGMIVPLRTRTEIVGAISLMAAESGTRFSEEDLRFAEDLAGRAAAAIENARLYRETQRSLQALREADRRKDEFLAMLAHELRNPVAPIVNALEILRLRSPDPEVVKRQRETIGRNVVHLTRMLDDLLEVSRINEGKIALRKVGVELADVVEQALAAVRPTVDERGHQLAVSLPLHTVYLSADPTRVVQILTNLLNNAAKYTDRGGKISLIATSEAGELEIRVRDNGRGIEPALLPHVFELFVQGERSSARAEGGLGVGLTMVKRLVELHGGTIAAHSPGPGKGSEFVLRLPIAALEDPSSPVADAAAGPTRNSQIESRPSKRVLVVEDNPDSAETLAELLQLWGHEVRVVHDGPTALDVVPSFAPDVVLLDIGLPGMDGYQVAARLRTEGSGFGVQGSGSEGRDVARLAGNDLDSKLQPPRGHPNFKPILVALTGYGQEADRRQATEAGFDHHLTKPVDPAELQRLLGD